MQRPIAADKPSSIPGVIDTIAEGFTTAVYRPLLLTVPMLLDLYYVAGWSLRPRGLAATLGDLVGEGSSPERTVGRAIDRFGTWDLTAIVSFLVPSLLGDTGADTIFRSADRPVLSLGSPAVGLLALAGIIVLAPLALALFSVPVADAVIGRSRSVRDVGLAVLRAWTRLLGLLAMIAAVAGLIMAPLLVAWAAFRSIGFDLSPVVALAAFLLVVAGVILVWFAPEAIVVSEVGPVHALNRSVRIVRHHAGKCLGLILVSSVISIGLGGIFERMLVTAPGLLLGIVANALVVTGLAAASMRFYFDRSEMSPAAAVRP